MTDAVQSFEANDGDAIAKEEQQSDDAMLFDTPAISSGGANEIRLETYRQHKLNRKERVKTHKRRKRKGSRHKHRVQKSEIEAQLNTLAMQNSQAEIRKPNGRFLPGLLLGTFIGSAVTNFILEGFQS